MVSDEGRWGLCDGDFCIFRFFFQTNLLQISMVGNYDEQN